MILTVQKDRWFQSTWIQKQEDSQFMPFLSECLAAIFLMITSDQSMQSSVCPTNAIVNGVGWGYG